MRATKPRLRADLELFTTDAEEQEILVVRDPDMLAVETVPFGIGVLTLLQCLDGAHSLEDIATDLARRGAGFVSVEQLAQLVTVLDRYLLLDNENVAAERSARALFLAETVRPAAHAGQAYPAGDGPARAFLEDLLALAESPPPAPLRRLIAPHIDLRLGDVVHAHAHQRLATAPRPDVVVVLGVRHAAGTRRFIACRKDFATPLGTVRHDAELLDRIEARYGEPLSLGELAHRTEHSVEFQALWLAHHWPEDPPTIVPLLIGSFHDFVDEKTTPQGNEEVERFLAALRGALDEDGRDVLTIASVDLAHVGPVYDDPDGLDEAMERALEEKDRALLDHALAGDAETWFRQIAADGNARHICGLAPVYLTLRLREGPGELLRYGQGRIHPESGSVVSYCAIAYAE